MKKTLKKIIWYMRYIDIFYPFLVFAFKIGKFTKEERNLITRAIYDLNYEIKDDTLLKYRKDFLLRMLFLNILITLLMLSIPILLLIK